MVPVLPHHLTGQALAVGRNGFFLVAPCPSLPREAVLGPHRNAALVRDVVFQMAVRIMRQTDHVHAQIGYPLPFAAQIFIAHRVPGVFILRMLVDAAKLRLAPVQEKALVLDRDGAQSHPLRHCVAYLSAHADFSANRVKIGLPNIPEFGPGDFSRGDLEAIGGFEALLDYLADDYELGRRIASTGKKVELSAAIVTTFLPAYTVLQFLRHQLRWSRTIRDARRWGYTGLVFTFGLPWALVTLLAAHGAAWAWALFALTFAARLAVGFVAAVGVLHDRQIVRNQPFRNQVFRTEVFRNILLLPLRDLIAPFIWAASFMGNRIHWRGECFVLKDGKPIRTIAPS